MNDVKRLTVRTTDPLVWLPPLAAAGYPFLLMLFHRWIGPPGSAAMPMDMTGAAIMLLLAFCVPALGIRVAARPAIPTGFRRLAYASVAAPTVYVFLGVVQALLGSPIPDPWVWCAIWLAATIWAARSAEPATPQLATPALARWRVAHGLSALIVCAYVLFHLANHLAGLLGPAEHRAVMDWGRTVYRSPLIEPPLVLACLFQIGSGLYLAWRWSAAPHDPWRTFQVASGLYLAMFLLGHMNSVFIYARLSLGIPTDWDFATGAPTGLIHDPWNIRLLPHYALGVFFVLGHLASGLRVVSLAHGAGLRGANRGGFVAIAASAAIAIAIVAGMSGLRVG